ncbi:MAG: cysteine synthase A [Bacteroidales bacterium]
MKFENILESIGNTPHLHLKKLYPGAGQVWIKLERANPAGSIKDRIAWSMVKDAEESGILKPGSTIIEPTSGNTGIGLAMVAAVKGYRVILVMPESMSIERRNIMKVYGAEIELTPREKGMNGAIERSRELASGIGDAWIPSQFDNPANPAIHASATAREILKDFPGGIDYLVTGVGTGGHISGVGRVLKEKMPGIEVYAVEPADSPVIGGGEPGPHGIQGIGAGFIPENLDTSVLDGTYSIEKIEAFEYAKKAAMEEGVFVGISTGASLAAVAKLLDRVDPASTILTFNYDTGERYLSVEDLF